MNASMACQRARIAKGLYIICWLASTILQPKFCIRGKTYLAASLTHVWLFSGMHSLMHSQGRALNELFAAAGVVTNVGPNTAMNAF